MKVNSVLYNTGAHLSKPCTENECRISEFAYLPKAEENPLISASGLKKILIGVAAIAVAVSLSRIKMPWKHHQKVMNKMA